MSRIRAKKKKVVVETIFEKSVYDIYGVVFEGKEVEFYKNEDTLLGLSLAMHYSTELLIKNLRAGTLSVDDIDETYRRLLRVQEVGILEGLIGKLKLTLNEHEIERINKGYKKRTIAEKDNV